MREKDFTKAIKKEELAHKKEVVDMAISYRRLKQSEEFQAHQKLIEKALKNARADLEILKSFDVNDILKNTEKYLLKRVEIETRVTVLEHVLNMPDNYIKAQEKYESEK